MTLGVALCVRSNLGSSVISSLPYVLSLAGPVSFLPEWTIGHYTILMNFVFVICQILILRKQFELVQLFQLLVGFVFGWLIDFNMWLNDFLTCETLVSQILTQLAGCTVMGIGTMFAMVYVGLVVKHTMPHIKWFDRVLAYVPGFHRYLVGLLRFITKN